MSGIDEIGNNGIPECPVCESRTEYWILQDKKGLDLGFLNYHPRHARSNGEFNLEFSKERVLQDTTLMECYSCSYIADGFMLKEGLGAIRNDRRRFPELVGDR